MILTERKEHFKVKENYDLGGIRADDYPLFLSSLMLFSFFRNWNVFESRRKYFQTIKEIRVWSSAVLFKKKVCPFCWERWVFHSPTQGMDLLVFTIERQSYRDRKIHRKGEDISNYDQPFASRTHYDFQNYIPEIAKLNREIPVVPVSRLSR